MQMESFGGGGIRRVLRLVWWRVVASWRASLLFLIKFPYCFFFPAVCSFLVFGCQHGACRIAGENLSARLSSRGRKCCFPPRRRTLCLHFAAPNRLLLHSVRRLVIVALVKIGGAKQSEALADQLVGCVQFRPGCCRCRAAAATAQFTAPF